MHWQIGDSVRRARTGLFRALFNPIARRHMNSTTHCYQIGDAKITRITETLLQSLPLSFLYQDWNAEVLSKHPHLVDLLDADQQHISLSVHTWLVEWNGQVLLVDTGIGNHKDRPFSRLFHQLQTPYMERLAAAGIEPSDVDHVLMTHLHADHVGWNTYLRNGEWVPTFPNARYVMPQGDLDYYATPASENRRMVFEDSVAPVLASGQVISIPNSGGEYLDGLRFLPTPGHCAGHMSISLTSHGETALFTGDVVHTPLQLYRPAWNSTFCMEQDEAKQSRRWMLDFAADKEVCLFTAHFAGASAGRITRQDDFYHWLPA
jgi:glyoxylase-like metal-dependent hydrolase (beta-lactamase superfamily II)